MGETSAQGKEHILFLLPFPENPDLLNYIKKKHPNVEVEYQYHVISHADNLTPKSLPDETWKKVTILVTLQIFPHDPKTAPNLHLIHVISAGTDRLAGTPIWKDTSITITNSSGVHGPQISEWVILQILSNSHKEKLLLDWQKKHVWGNMKEIGPVRDGVGQRLGVLGYGAIGRQTARICKALGMDVIAYTAGPRETPESKKYTGYTVPGTGDPDGLIPSTWYSGTDKAALHNFLKQDIDFLLISVPLTPSTLHSLSAEEFSILSSRKTFVINIARGPIIVTSDLITALKEGKLRGAALDVTDPEPLPEDSELWDLENVAITPHVSGLGTTYAERSLAILDINLGRLEEGGKLINVVSREKGY